MADESPTPWKAVNVYGYGGYHNHDILDAENDSIILDVDSEEGPGFAEADALLIVRAVNAHKRLVAALKKAEAALSPDWVDGPRGEYLKCPACGATDFARVEHRPDCTLIEIEAALAAADQ